MDTLKASFLKHFELVSRDSQIRLWEKKVELANLGQGKNEKVAKMLVWLSFKANDDEVLMHAGLLRPMAEGGYLRVPHV